MGENVPWGTMGLEVGLRSATCPLVTPLTCSPLSSAIIFANLPLLTAMLSFPMTSAGENALTAVMVHWMVTCVFNSLLAGLRALKLLTLTGTPILNAADKTGSSDVRDEEATIDASDTPCSV